MLTLIIVGLEASLWWRRRAGAEQLERGPIEQIEGPAAEGCTDSGAVIAPWHASSANYSVQASCLRSIAALTQLFAAGQKKAHSIFPHKYIMLLPAFITLFSIAPVRAFEIDFLPGQRPIHEDITAEALRRVTAVTTSGEVLRFCPEAIEEIIKGNRTTDYIPQSQLTSENHFDDEKLADGSFRLFRLRSNVQELALQGRGRAAQFALGGALHTLQDFYAHSNFVETSDAVINGPFGTIEGVLDDPFLDEQFCPQDPSVLDRGRRNLTTGYFSLSQKRPMFASCGDVPPGKCAHGGVEQCPGINKDGPDRAFHDRARRSATIHTEEYVKMMLIDEIQMLPSSRNPDKALRALMGQCGQPAAGPVGTLGFLIDVTGSMGNDIDAVKLQVRSMVLANRNASHFLLTPFSDPNVGPSFTTRDANELLSAVNSLQTPPRQGGDCPERYYSGLIEALGNAQANSTIWTYTDDSIPKDADLKVVAERLAKAKKIEVIQMLLNLDCAEAPDQLPLPDELAGSKLLLTELADDTGGFFFDFSGGLFFNRGVLTRDIPRVFGRFFQDAGETLFSRNFGTILRGIPEVGIVTTVPVDSTVTELVFYVTGVFVGRGGESDAPNFMLRRPSGALVTGNDRDVTATFVRVLVPGPRVVGGFLLVRIKAPRPGSWDLTVLPHGRGEIRPIMAVLAHSSIQLLDFEFIEEPVERAKSVHGGFVPILGEPVMGATATARATLFGPASTHRFRLVDEEGLPLQEINLDRGATLSTTDQFLGSFTVPDVPFRVEAFGEDLNGHSYARRFPSLFRPQSVQVTVDPATDNRVVPIGRRTSFAFRIRNFGDLATFRTGAVATTGFIPPRRGRGPIILDRGETGTFEILLAVPADTAEGAEIDLVATATSTTNPAVTGSATLRLTASNSANLMPLANAGADIVTTLGSVVTLDGSGSRDPDEGPDPLSFEWVQIAGPEITLAQETTAMPSFFPQVAGAYTFALSVNDGMTRSVEDEVLVTVDAPLDPGGEGGSVFPK